MKDNKVKAVFFMILASLFFALMGVAVKKTGNIPVFQKVFFRNIVILLSLLIYNKYFGNENLLGSKKNRKYLLLRSLLGVISLAAFFYALTNLYMADATLLNKLSPFFVTLFAAYFLKEKLSKIQIPILLLAFSGSLMIIKPRFDLSIIPALVGLFSAIGSGGAYTVVRYLKKKESTTVIIFYFSLISLIVSFPIMMLNYSIPNINEFITLIFIGFFALGGQIFLTLAYKFSRASEISIYMYAHVLFGALFGYLFWNEIPDLLSIGGAVLILVSAVLDFLARRRDKKIKEKI